MVDAFLDNLTIRDGCWDWEGGHSVTGYSVFKPHVDGHRLYLYAHRFAYEYFVARVPAGLELDHLCRNRGCVNPSHLEPIDHTENMRRALQYRPKRYLKSRLRG